ncbi:E3 ubiquitin-protein ligase makorin-like isoform X2 [Andrographis paniculata]|uniref:E3 ubiquitin-protein ligase makorin-like isoform X2 n=1 Tax=Andrographis paniculata TaxID=175694 RepID=UPI0021E7C113|nr:E3 ubiquitin-protein ligase makorin-like isoform X2 [Andrographis paniculata]
MFHGFCFGFSLTPAMPKRVLCKFFAHGACLKGELCEFSHDWKALKNNICPFYQKENCAYGSQCRYEHINLSRSQPSSEDAFRHVEPLSGTAVGEARINFGHSPSLGPLSSPIRYGWKEKTGHEDILDKDCDVGYLSCNVDPMNQPICSFAAVGDCPRGEKCPHIHGESCPICGKRCLHPFRPLEREQHMKMCEKRKKRFETLQRSQEIECSVCLEYVLSKPTLGEKKFGILSECDHPFCISCIRNWRSSSLASGLDVNSTLRACPICRKLSYFVVPSVIWYSSKEEKQDIINRYKAKLSSIDCKYFDFGNGTCPFGTSCFYKDGHYEGVILHLAAEDGSTVIAKNIRFYNFLRNLQIR